MSTATVITGKEDIAAYRLLALRHALNLECKGLKASRGRSAYKTIKVEFGLKGNKVSVADQFAKILMDRGILFPK